MQDNIKESPHTRWNISPSGLFYCLCLQRRQEARDYVTFHPLPFLFLWLHQYTPSAVSSSPRPSPSLLSAPFERTDMINRDLREHGRGMVVAAGAPCMCVCALMHSRAKPAGGRWTTEASNVYRGTAGGLGWASLFSDWLTQASSGSETHNWLRKIHKLGRHVHDTEIRHLTSWWRDEWQG